MKRILKYIWLWGLLSLCVSSCEEEAAVINPDVSHDKPTEVVIGDSPRLCSELQTDNQQVFLIVTDKENEVVTDHVSLVMKEAATETKNLTVMVDKDFDVEAFQCLIQPFGIFTHFIGSISAAPGGGLQKIDGREAIFRRRNAAVLLNLHGNLLGRFLGILL